jgi:hypothetical protein
MRSSLNARGRRGIARVTVALVVIAGCGGGGESNPPVQSGVQVLLRDGDTLPDGFPVNTIESANMASDRSVAVIVSEPGTPTLNGVFVISPSGQVSTVMTPAQAPEGLSLTTVRNLEMASTGEVTFEVGDQLGQDGVFFYRNGQLSALARTQPGETPPGFRILGELGLGAQGMVAFTAGVIPCEVDNSSGTERIECDLRLYAGLPGQVTEISVPNGLEALQPSAVIISLNRNGEVALGLPASGSEPLVGLLRDGVFQGLLNRRQQFPGLGTLLSARPRAIASNSDVVVDAGFDTDNDGERDQNRVLLYSQATIQSIAENGVPAPGHDGRQVFDVRGIDIDDAGRVIYSFEFGEPGETARFLSLRAWDGTSSQEIAFEGLRFGRDEQDEALRILEIEQIRVSRTGDVVFTATIGFFDDEDTRRIDREAILRWTPASGTLEQVIATKTDLPEGNITSVSIQDLSDSGDLLVIASVIRQANRVLLLIPRT